MKHTITTITAIAAIILLAACSTTRRIPEGETLYTGVKKFKIATPGDSIKLPGDLNGELAKTINVKPNNPLYSPYIRTPFPIGLWVYNNWNDSAKGLKKWLYNKLVAQPVLISDVKPEVRVKMLENQLHESGFFNSSASYTIDYDKHNHKKARINYNISTGQPYRLDTIIYPEPTTPLLHAIDSIARRMEYLTAGEQFCVDSLESVRTDITNRLRNKGFYYFRPDFIEFLADSTAGHNRIALKLTIASNIAPMATLQYKLGKIQTILNRQSTSNPGTPDTIQTPRGELIVMRPQRLREHLIPSCITFRPGRIFSVRDMNRTQTRLSRLGIFSSIELQPYPADTSAANPTLDLLIQCRYDRPMQATLEVNVSSKSNSYLGPGLQATLQHNNIFGGGEKLSFSLNANYEWQTGHSRSSVFNSYEFGLNTTLSFPRLLAPAFIRRTQRELNWTRLNLGASILNRPHYFKMSQANIGIQYEWNATRHVVNQFTPFKLTYTKLQHTTPEFDSIMAINPAIALSFQNQFIPQMSYSYTIDKFLERAKTNGFNFNLTLTEAGNIFSGIWRLCGVKGQKKMFGTPFSQFIKGQAQMVYSRRLLRGKDQWLVSRVLVGAEHAYGNSSEVPYSEQFYIGGANSIRAFTVRSLGPGSYRAPGNEVNGYFDQTGTFKLEMNVEYRFPIVGMLHGAAFVDAGNIWLLKKDELRPGGKLEGKTFLRDVALGTGIGLRYDLSMLVIRGDLGFGLHAPYADYSRHYFNIPLRNAFAFHLAIGYPF